MSLQTCIDVESTRTLIHRQHELTVSNLLQGQLLSIVPMLIVEILPNDRMRLDSVELISLRHVEII